jgi:hypothetical protein
MQRLHENIETLQSALEAPCLGLMPHRASRESPGPAVPLRLDALLEAR